MNGATRRVRRVGSVGGVGRIAGAALAALALAACSKESAKRSDAPAEPPPAADVPAAPSAAGAPAGPPPSASGDATQVAAPAPKSTVKVLDPGREPRRALAYGWRADQRERMDIELRTTVSADSGGAHQDVPLAPLEIGIALEPRGVSADGDLRLAWHVVSAEVGARDASAPAQVAEGWSAQLLPVAHLAGTAVVSSHGLSRGVTVEPGSAGEAGPDAEMVVQVVQMLRDVAAPLPDEPVGKGARWQKISTLDAKSGHATQTDTFTLIDLAGNAGSLDDVLAQTASPQPLPAPAGVAQPSPARMDQLLTSGDAKVRFDLGRIVAQTALDGTTSMAVSVPNSRMNMVMHLGITVRGTTP
jgi:hypothetical protein